MKTRSAALILTTILLLGCSKGEEQSRYDEIKLGMTRQDTISILGKPAHDLRGRIVKEDSVRYSSSETASVLTWKNGGDKYILVNIENDKVIAKTKQGF